MHAPAQEEVRAGEETQPQARQGVFVIERLVSSTLMAYFAMAVLLLPSKLSFRSEPGKGWHMTLTARVWGVLFGFFLLAFNVSCVVALFSVHSWIGWAKVLFIFFTWWISYGALLIFNQLKNITTFLSNLEEEAGQARDESVMLLRAGHASIKSLNGRVFSEVKQEEDSIAELLKTIGPLALMFIRQEKNIFFWGLSLLKVAKKGFSVAKRYGDKD